MTLRPMFLVRSLGMNGAEHQLITQAKGVPYAATRVGDAAEILGDTGATVPPCSPEALAEALCSLLDRRSTCPALGRDVRAGVVKRYSVSGLVARTEALLETLVE